MRKLLQLFMPCRHKEVTKDSYGGFFSYDTYDCNRCGKHWDEAVIFSPNTIAKVSLRRLESRIEKDKVKVTDNSVEVTDFMNDSGLGLDIAKRRLGIKS